MSGPTQHSDLSELLELARVAVSSVTVIHRARLSDPSYGVSTKSSATDFVTDTDWTAEATIIDALAHARPHDAILSEETVSIEGTTGVRWIVDPLDGTTNFIRGYPSFGCSIAAEVNGAAVVGAVGDSIRGLIYDGIKGGSAQCDGQAISIDRPPPSLGEAIVATGFSYDAGQRQAQGRAMAVILPRVADIRRSGSAALDLCRLAAGHIDAYFELDLAPWDYAAGLLIARAAGAQAAELPAPHGQGPAVVAAHPQIFDDLITLLEEAGALSG